MIVEPFRPDHLESFIAQPAQEYARANLGSAAYRQALVGPYSFAGLIDGRVVACAGVVPLWEGRADAWALVAQDIGPLGMHRLHFAVARHLKRFSFRRIEAACDASFLQAHRWLELLGFAYEGPLKAYTPDGRDCLRFARIA